MISKKYTEPLILLVFIITKFILQYVLIHPVYELHRDEYLHLDQAKHLAWGYLSVPPLTSWNSYIILLLGNSEFWIKFFPALYGALTIVMVWVIIKELKGNLFALVLGATCILLSVLLRINLLYQPNSLDILLWVTFYYLFLKYIHSGKPKWIYILAVVTAVGFLNKYNIAFLILGFLPAVLLTRHRVILLNKHLYFAVFLGLVIISPNLVWQYQNNFPVFTHLNQLASTQLVYVNR
ncbi:MAG: glycosyltransferase family 39 protein, partial [Bacteroidota bacterium]|nr:glycosyltransferase family 39 protein [Bacteroidota bacterium]